MLYNKSNPKPYHLPKVSRSRDLINPIIRGEIGEVVSGKRPWPIFIHGDVGTGKTLACLCLLDAAGGGCMYKNVRDLLDQVRDADRGELWDQASGEKVTTSKFWHNWEGYRLTVLDEMGSRDRVTDFAYDTTKKAIDLREGKPAIYISNLRPDDLGQIYDDRIASRIISGTVLSITGDDRRLKASLTPSTGGS